MGVGSNGATSGVSGAFWRASLHVIYLLIAALVAAACIVDGFTIAHDVSWRRGTPGNLWEPMLWEATSCVMVIALLPLVRRGAVLVRSRRNLLVTGLSIIALAGLFSAAHILGMVALRKFAYGSWGWSYPYQWTLTQILYEARKDLFSYALLAVLFWLAERTVSAASPAVPNSSDGSAPLRPPSPPGPTGIWLRDGRTSVLVDASDILWVGSAGNYVEYALSDGRRLLIRATLRAEEARLAALGLVRIHRTRLVNLTRVVALEWETSGDFKLRLDSGDAIAGSRRFKAAVAGLG